MAYGKELMADGSEPSEGLFANRLLDCLHEGARVLVRDGQKHPRGARRSTAPLFPLLQGAYRHPDQSRKRSLVIFHYLIKSSACG